MNTLSPKITVEHILTEDCVVEVEITEVLEVPVVEPILTEDRIVEVATPEVAVLEVPIVPVVKRPRKRRNTQKVKMAKYSPMPGVHIKRIKNRLRLVYLNEV